MIAALVMLPTRSVLVLSFLLLVPGGAWAQTVSPVPAASTPTAALDKPAQTAEEKKLEEMRKKADDDADAQRKAAEDRDLAKEFTSGKLIRYGVTAGLAFTAIGRLHPNIQKQWGVAPMPYVAYLPFLVELRNYGYERRHHTSILLGAVVHDEQRKCSSRS